jgi:predicted CopG family antitoxin
MSRDYSNITLYGVQQEDIVSYLSLGDYDAYVSPTMNNFTIVYFSSSEQPLLAQPFEEILKLQQAMQQMLPQSFSELVDDSFSEVIRKLQDKNNDVYRVIKKYGESMEASLVYLASTLSKHFACPALAVLVKERVDFWYHLNQNGLMVDEYTNSATFNWQPGYSRDGDYGEEIRGGDVKSLCQIFNCSSKMNEVESILYKSDNPESYSLLPFRMDYESLLNLPSFPNAIIRHRVLASALKIPALWVTYMTYSRIEEQIFDHLVGEVDAPSPEDMLMALQKTS